MHVVMMNDVGKEFTGRAGRARGMTTNIHFKGRQLAGKLSSVHLIGRQDLTNAERAHEEMLLLLLQGKASLRSSSFIRKLWFPAKADRKATNAPKTIAEFSALNPSQKQVVSAMISSMPLVIVHGTNSEAPLLNYLDT